MAAFAICILAAGPAHGQFLLGPQFKSWWGNHSPVRHKHHHRHTTPRSTKKAPAQDAAKGPLQIIVSIADQRISVYDDGALIARSSVSTGVPDHPTPSGIFSIISKRRWHRSNLYSAAPMPYMQRLTWSGIALHAGVLPGYPASHGCIRLKKDFAIRLWHLTKRGTRVIIAPDDVRPVEIAHPTLSSIEAESRALRAGVCGRDCGERDDRHGGGASAVDVRRRYATSHRCPSSRFNFRHNRGAQGRANLHFCES